MKFSGSKAKEVKSALVCVSLTIKTSPLTVEIMITTIQTGNRTATYGAVNKKKRKSEDLLMYPLQSFSKSELVVYSKADVCVVDTEAKLIVIIFFCLISKESKLRNKVDLV